MKILVCLYDHIPGDAFISQQLGLKSLFYLFLGKAFYFQKPEQSFPALKHKLSFQIIKQKLEPQHWPELALAFKEYERVILWPLNQWLTEPLAAAQVLEKALQAGSTQIKLGNEFAFVLSMAKNPALPLFMESIQASNLTAKTSEINNLDFASPHRSFNHIESSSGKVIKTCSDKLKGAGEARFLTFVPPSLQKFFPPLLSSQEETQNFSYQIPRYEMLDLSRFLLHGALNEPEWQKVFNKVDEYFKSCPRKNVGKKQAQQALRALFIDKLKSRTQEYQAMPSTKNIASLVETLIHRLEKAIEDFNGDALTFSHGDLCFSNMLLDRKSFEMKFIDARGAMSADDTYLPLAYDFAKLSHCIHGHYDWIMAQNLVTPKQAEQHKILRAEFALLMKAHGINAELVRLGEASLFLSMLPLHMDQPHLHEAMIKSAELAISSQSEMSYAG